MSLETRFFLYFTVIKCMKMFVCTACLPFVYEDVKQNDIGFSGM